MSHAASRPVASLVLPPSLYLGPCSSASSRPFLEGNSISHVLSIGATPSEKVNGVQYQRISISDSPSSSITEVCNSACVIIDDALRSNNGTGKILIHCSAGISRSPMIVIAYLMKRQNMALKAALGCVVCARPQISPNPGFIQQLKELEVQLFNTSSLDIDELPRREKDRVALFADQLSVGGDEI
ncbi:protein-tyrosine phosphatase-like protein [Mariannaea sp. PMI_226]|nr:protein-tyrosine phosphatase-like protein [Mariannaea sp. PMI_226]